MVKQNPLQHHAGETESLAAAAEDVHVKSNYVECWVRPKSRKRSLLPTPQVPPVVKQDERA